MLAMLASVSQTATALLTAGGSVAATLVGVWVKRRRQSGSVGASEASELWGEGKDMREFLRDQVGSLQSQVNTLTERVDRLSDANDGLTIQLESARELVVLLKSEREELNHDLERSRDWTDELVKVLQAHGIDLPRKP